jgi:hypothetical protein
VRRIVSIGSVALTAAVIAMAAAPAFAQSRPNFQGSGQQGSQYGGGNHGQGGQNHGQGGQNYGNHGQPPRQPRRPFFPQPTQLVFTTSPAGGEVGTAETADVTIENAQGQTVDVPAAYAPALTFGGSGMDASPNGTAATATYTYSDGVYTVTFTPEDVQTDAVLTASASGLTTATSADFNVTAPPFHFRRHHRHGYR